MQAFEAVLAFFGIQWLTPIIGLAIVSASLAGFLTWLAGPSRSLLLVAREGGYMPPWFQRTNEAGVQQNILVAQGALTTVLALLSAFVPAVSECLLDLHDDHDVGLSPLCTCRCSSPRTTCENGSPTIPEATARRPLTLLCVMGFLSSAAAVTIGFVPPSQLGTLSTTGYLFFVGGGVLLLGLIVPLLFLWLQKPSWKAAEPLPDEPSPETAS